MKFNKKTSIINRLALYTAVLAFFCFTLIASSQNWSTFTVNPTSAKCTGIATDEQGFPHLFYYTPFQSSNSLFHSYWNGEVWTHEIIGNAASFHNNGPRATIDSLGNIHVIYFNNQLKLAYAFYNGTWQTEIIDNENNTGDHISFQLDGYNNPHVAYSKGTSNARYARKAGNQWQITDLSGSSTGKTSLALDSQGNPHIFYSGKYNYFDGVVWYQEVIPSIGSMCSMTLDNYDQPHICYYFTEGESYDLRYAYKINGFWMYLTIDPGYQLSKRGWYNTISLDQNGVLHISYLDHNLSQLKHAWGYGQNWSVEVIENLGNSAIWWTGNDLTFHGNNIYVSYYNQLTSQVRLATLAGDYAAPDNLTADVYYLHNVYLDWDHSGSHTLVIPTFFRVYSNDSIMAVVLPSSTDYLITGLDQGVYNFYITAVYGENESQASNVVTVSISNILFGDSNCDGTVNVLDVITTANYVLGLNPQPFCFENADVNQDGVVNVMDVIGSVAIILGKT